MSRRNRQQAHLHAVPDPDPRAGRKDGPTKHRSRAPDPGLFPLDEIDLMDAFDPGDDIPPLARRGIMEEIAAMGRAADGPPVADILDQLAALGLPPELVEQSRALGDEHQAELAGLLTAATAMLTGDPVDGLLSVWQPLLDKKVTAFDAEMATAEILWTFDGAIGEDDLVDGLTQLIGEVEHTGRPEALVMCRMLNHLGPTEIRGLATRAANTLAAGGTKDRPWVSSLGKAKFQDAYGFTDPNGRVLVVEFAHGRRQHAFVFVDDVAEDGLIGLNATDEVEDLRRELQLAAASQGFAVRNYDAAEAADGIRSALNRPLRPEDEDDEAEMEGTIPIVLERLRHLPPPGIADNPAPEQADEYRPPPGVSVHDFGPHPAARAKVVHRIKVTVAGFKPPIWRRLEVPSDITLEALHHLLQLSFGWNDDHLWQFKAANQVYGIGEIGVPHRNAKRVTIGEIAPSKGSTLEYVYDFGDNWVHRIRVEEVGPGKLDAGYPRCLAGRRAGPREEEWDEPQDADFEPTPFDLDLCNDRLAGFAARRRRR